MDRAFRLRDKEPVDVDGIAVNRKFPLLFDPSRRGGQFEAFDHDECAGFFELPADFLESLETGLGFAVSCPDLQSALSPSLAMFGNHLVFALVFAYVLPSLSALQNVVIGKHQEIITLTLIPIGGGFGKIVPIRPECVGMRISLKPLSGGISNHLSQRTKQQNEEKGQGTSVVHA